MTLHRIIGFIAGGLLVAAVGCEGRQSWVADWIGLGEGVSAESISGTYGDLTGRRATGDCESLGEPTPMAADLRIEVDGEAAGTADASSSSSSQHRRAGIRLAICDDGCERVERSFRLKPGVGGRAWRRSHASAREVVGPPAARACELEWRSDRLLAVEDGLEWQTRVHRGTVTLEGTMRCDESLASELGEERECVRRRMVRVRRRAASDD